MHRHRRARRASHIRRFTWNTSPKTRIYELGTIRFVQFFYITPLVTVAHSWRHLHGASYRSINSSTSNGVLLVVCRGARHDEQEVRKPVHNLLPRRLTRRHAVPRKPDRARHPRGSEQRPTTTRRPTLAWEPRRRQVRRRPVHADDGRIYGRLSHTQELPRNSSVPR